MMEHTGTHDDVARFEAEQDAVMDAQFLIQDLLDERNLNRKEAARLLGVTPARFSQLMRADANPTLRTLAGILHVLGGVLCVERKRVRLSASVEAPAIKEDAFWAQEALERMTPMKRPNYDFRALLANVERAAPVNNDNNAVPVEGQHSQTIAA